MSKRKISSYLGGERNEETEKDKDHNDLRVEVAEGDGNTNPKSGKNVKKSHSFQSKWLKEHLVEIRKSTYVLSFLSLG